LAAEQNQIGALENPWAYEREAREQGCKCIAGVDEAGRGPLAGPVVAAAVVLPETFDTTGIDDSKKLTPAQREAAYERIVHESVDFGVGIVEAGVIDEINILKATHLAARDALLGLRTKVDLALVDGRPMVGLPCSQKAIIQGDSKCVSIAAASIVAKVTRDRIMVDYDRKFPEYGFCRHKGYYTPEHLQAVEQNGVCEIHRKTFFPICEKVNLTCPLPGLEED
jgi:ribonuclease HII